MIWICLNLIPQDFLDDDDIGRMVQICMSTFKLRCTRLLSELCELFDSNNNPKRTMGSGTKAHPQRWDNLGN